MFPRLFRRLFSNTRNRSSLMFATCFLGYSLYQSSIKLYDEGQQEIIQQKKVEVRSKQQEYVKKIKTKQICESKQLVEGTRKIVTIEDEEGKQHRIILFRQKNKIYAVYANCPYQDPFNPDAENPLDQGLLFADKLYCPNHGCTFCIKTGNVENGPATDYVPIFKAFQKNSKIILMYPGMIPKSIEPSYMWKNPTVHNKVVIMGGDDNASIGCINSLREVNFDGEITVVQQEQYIPFKQSQLHKHTLNVKAKAQKEGKKVTQKLIESQLEHQIYRKLQFKPRQWFQQHDIDFVYNSFEYRIINKKFYPYLSFVDGTKMQFDALLINPGVLDLLPRYKNISTKDTFGYEPYKPENVFKMYRSRKDHLSFHKFLNMNDIKNLLIIGYNIRSLEFIQSLHKEFPDIKIRVIDEEKDTAMMETFGPDIQKSIVKDFTKQGVQFYVKIRDKPLFSNTFAPQKLQILTQQQKCGKQGLIDPKRYQNSIQVRVSSDCRFNVDGVVMFSHLFEGNTEYVKKGKYTDFFFSRHNFLEGDMFARTDNIKLFSAGISSFNHYFMFDRKVQTNNQHYNYEMGYTAGLNMQALRIPHTYVPVEIHELFGKKILYSGFNQFYDSLVTFGSIQNWDFITLYGMNREIIAISASPSKANDLSILREAIRVNCLPDFEDFITGYWKIQDLKELIKKLDRSGCYKDIILRNKENIHKKDLIWMERTAQAGFENDKPMFVEDKPQYEVGDDGKLKQL